MKKIQLPLLIGVVLLSGCAHKSLSEISQMSNYSLVDCVTNRHNDDATKANCGSEIQRRISAQKMTQQEYSQYDTQARNSQQQALSGFRQVLMQQQAATDKANADALTGYAQSINSMPDPSAPKVNVHQY